MFSGAGTAYFLYKGTQPMQVQAAARRASPRLPVWSGSGTKRLTTITLENGWTVLGCFR